VKFKLEINTDNDAFHEDRAFGLSELSRILFAVAYEVERFGENESTVSDINGNIVGSYEFVDD